MTETTKDKSGAPPCGLYYRIGENVILQDAMFLVRQMAMVINRASGYEKNMHVIEISPVQNNEDVVQSLVRLIQGAGLVAIIKDDFNLAKDSDADGVLLSDIGNVLKARDALGKDTIIGQICGASKEAIEQAMNADVDYITLGTANYKLPDFTLLSLWNEDNAHRPVVAMGEITQQVAGLISSSGAGFVDVTRYVDEHEKGVAQAVVNMLDVLEEAN